MLEARLEEVPEEYRREAVEGLFEEMDTKSRVPSSTKRWVEKSLTEVETYYAVKDDELDWLKGVGAVAAAAITSLKDPLAVVGALVVLLYRYRKKRAVLDGEEGTVLLTLKAHPEGLSVKDLVLHLPLKQPLTAAEVQGILERLQTKRLTDGTVQSFVASKAGLYWAAGV